MEVKESDNYGELILKTPEKVICKYYNQDIDILSLLGKKVKVWGSIIEVYNNTIPNTFNYQKYLYNNHIYISYKINKITILKNENIFYKIKKNFQNRIDKISHNDLKIKNYLNLFLLGNKDYLEDDLYNIYKNNGIWHLFALSGLHFSIIIFLLEKLLKFFPIKNIIIFPFLIFYLFLVNFKISLMRVIVYYILKNILTSLNINLGSFKIYLLSLSFLILFNPFIIYDIGFLYSYLITGFLILSNNKIKGNYLKKLLIISLISLLASLPLTINLNYEINILSFLFNIFFVPFISFLVFPLVLISFLIPLFIPLLKISILILENLNIYLIKIGFNLIIPKIPLILIILYYLFLFLFIKFSKSKYFIILILIITFNIILPKLDNNYYVYYLDVGQGDSALLISPHKKEVIMIDTGGNPRSSYHNSQNTILFLKSLGITKIDLLILSHGDSDHAYETLYLLDNYLIKNIVLNTNGDNELEKEIRKKGHVVNNYNSHNFSYLNILDYKGPSENESSILSYFQIYDYSFLFMGDASSKVERKFIQDYDLPVQFLKIAHHGSKTSSDITFLKKLNPKLAIISSGRNNIYNHPSKEVLNNLEKLKIKYLNTQTSGTIELKLRKNNYILKTYEP